MCFEAVKKKSSESTEDKQKGEGKASTNHLGNFGFACPNKIDGKEHDHGAEGRKIVDCNDCEGCGSAFMSTPALAW